MGDLFTVLSIAGYAVALVAVYLLWQSRARRSAPPREPIVPPFVIIPPAKAPTRRPRRFEQDRRR